MSRAIILRADVERLDVKPEPDIEVAADDDINHALCRVTIDARRAFTLRRLKLSIDVIHCVDYPVSPPIHFNAGDRAVLTLGTNK